MASSTPERTAVEANEAFYGEPAAGTDDYWRLMAAPRARVRTILRELSRDRPAGIVDLGCGNGVMLDEIRARFPGARLAGIDLSERQIEENRRRDPSIAWHAANLDGACLPLPGLGARFDAVVAMEIVEHVDDPAAFLRTAATLATPSNGRLYLSTQSGRVGETERRVGHRRHFTTGEMSELLVASGWRPVRVWNCGWPFHDLSKWWANRDPDASMNRFARGRYGAGERLVCSALRAAFRLNSGRRGAQLFAVAAPAD